MGRLFIWGASGHARVVADIVRQSGVDEIAGLFDDVSPAGPDSHGAPVYRDEADLANWRTEGVSGVLIAVGNNAARMQIAARARALGFELATAIHPSAVVAPDATIGPGTVIAAGAIVNPGANIGANGIINTAATVDHECDVADGVHVGPGVHLGGQVRVGIETWIGIGSSVIHRIRIGARSIIGAGSVVVRDIPSGVIAYGVPARVVRSIQG